jgi:hypothetical protein
MSRRAYDYCDADGRLVYQVIRKVPKRFLQRRPDPNKPGEWIWNIRGVTPLPYKLPQLLAAVHDTRFIVEGEKDVDALIERGFTATSNLGGAGNWQPEPNPLFAGKPVCILPDEDEPGHLHALQVAANLHGIASEVRIFGLPGHPKDVSDWLDADGDTATLVDIAKAAPLWEPEEAPQGEQPADNDDYSVPIHWHGEVDTSPLREWTVEGMLPRRGTALLSDLCGARPCRRSNDRHHLRRP